MSPEQSEPRRHGRPSLKAGALLTLLAFGCTTVRVPASGIAASVPVHGGWAEPQVELWIESGRDVSAEESARAVAAAQAALQQAVADSQPNDPDTVLVVRAQGVSRTGSRRSAQHAGVAGVVVGAAVLVAAVVALVASKGSSHGKAPGVSGRPASGRAAAPAVAARPPRPGPPPAIARRSGGGVSFGVGVGVQLPLGGAEPYGAVSPVPVPQELPPPQPAGPSAEIAVVTLAPPPPLDVGRRGFFAGDHLRLELLVVDRHSGAVVWVKTAEDDVDPCDAVAVRKVLDGALAEPGGWTAPGAEPSTAR